MTDFYDVLAVPRTAKADEIKQAYLRLARDRHPDRFQDRVEKERAQEFFKELTEAFNTLRDEGKRRAYDAQLAKPQPKSPAEFAELARTDGARLLEQGKVLEAIEQLRVALYHLPEDPKSNALFGRAMLRTRDGAREGVMALEKAVTAEPKAEWHVEIATALLGERMKVRARKHAEAALKLAPNHPEVRRVATEAGLFDPPTPAPPPADGGGLLGRLRRKP
jgi:curved DNA-binding protein CbpA